MLEIEVNSTVYVLIGIYTLDINTDCDDCRMFESIMRRYKM